MIRIHGSLSVVVLAMSAMGASACASNQTRADSPETTVQRETASGPDDATGREVYEAHLAPLNVGVAGGPTDGRATLTIRGDSIDIAVDVDGASPGIVHIQHIHGFVDGRRATCANASSDANGDGIVDLVETEETSGTTLVPFHGEPASLEIAGDGYPTADATGAFHYRATVSRSELEQALEGANGAGLDLGNRVVYVHGVPENAALPGTVASLPDVPAHVTLPIACGELQQIAPRE